MCASHNIPRRFVTSRAIFVPSNQKEVQMLSQQLREYISACFTGLWVESHEHDDALAEITQFCRQEDWRLAVWDVDRGLQVHGQKIADAGGSDPLAAIRSLGTLATPDSSALLVLVNFHRFLNSAEIVQAVA